MDLTAKDITIGTLIILLVSTFGYVITQEEMKDWYYCSAENNLKRCESLSKYGVEDARCNFFEPDSEGKTSDICTFSGVRYPWKPMSDYVDIVLTGKEDIVVTSLQKCEIEYYNVVENVYGKCSEERYNLSDCIEWKINASSPTGESCIDWSKYDYVYSCKTGEQTVQKNRTICKPVGYQINYTDKSLEIKHNCCGFFNESPYKQYKGYSVISCKQELNNICNPIIQQTSKDESVYDEAGRIFVLKKDGIEPHLVGEYDYFLDKDIYVGKVEVIK